MRTLTIAILAVAACREPSPPGFSTGPGVTTASASTSTSSTGGDTSSTGPADDSAGMDSAGESTTGLLRDVGATVDFGSAQPPGCKGKVDLLFLISRYVSMESEQTQLLASFPGFVDTIQEKLADFDVHIMAANPDPGWAGWVCEKLCKQPPELNCDEDGYICNDLAWDVTPCDETIGAGAIFNAGAGAANRHCALYGGNRYIVQGEPDMDDALECIAKVGWSGDNNIGDAVIAAVKPAINADGGCNAGFLRDDALLVLVIIADSGDASDSYPYEQYNAVVAAKGGDPGAVVVLHVTGREDTGEPHEPGCSYQPDHIIKLRQLGMMFPFYLEGDTCAPSYAPFFDAATDLIGEACSSFIPG